MPTGKTPQGTLPCWEFAASRAALSLLQKSPGKKKELKKKALFKQIAISPMTLFISSA
jgi:hypothetical protein